MGPVVKESAGGEEASKISPDHAHAHSYYLLTAILVVYPEYLIPPALMLRLGVEMKYLKGKSETLEPQDMPTPP